MKKPVSYGDLAKEADGTVSFLQDFDVLLKPSGNNSFTFRDEVMKEASEKGIDAGQAAIQVMKRLVPEYPYYKSLRS